MSAIAILETYKASDAKLKAGKHDARDVAIVALWSAVLTAQAQVDSLKKELDVEKQVTAQSSQAMTEMALRYAAKPQQTIH